MVQEELFNFRNIKNVINRVKQRLGNLDNDIDKKENSIKDIKRRIQKTVQLYNNYMIETDELEAIIEPLRRQQREVEKKIKTFEDWDNYKKKSMIS